MMIKLLRAIKVYFQNSTKYLFTHLKNWSKELLKFLIQIPAAFILLFWNGLKFSPFPINLIVALGYCCVGGPALAGLGMFFKFIDLIAGIKEAIRQAFDDARATYGHTMPPAQISSIPLPEHEATLEASRTYERLKLTNKEFAALVKSKLPFLQTMLTDEEWALFISKKMDADKAMERELESLENTVKEASAFTLDDLTDMLTDINVAESEAILLGKQYFDGSWKVAHGYEFLYEESELTKHIKTTLKDGQPTMVPSNNDKMLAANDYKAQGQTYPSRYKIYPALLTEKRYNALFANDSKVPSFSKLSPDGEPLVVAQNQCEALARIRALISPLKAAADTQKCGEVKPSKTATEEETYFPPCCGMM